MATWAATQVQAQFNTVLDQVATEGPQEITRDGKPVAVLVSIADWKRSTGTNALDVDDEPGRAFLESLRTAPEDRFDFDVLRPKWEPRKVEF